MIEFYLNEKIKIKVKISLNKHSAPIYICW